MTSARPLVLALADVLLGVRRELDASAVLSRSMQDAASALLHASPQAPSLSVELQGLDLLAQRLDGLANFVAALADQVDASVRVDASDAAREVSLGDLAHRLQLSVPPNPRPAQVELF